MPTKKKYIVECNFHSKDGVPFRFYAESPFVYECPVCLAWHDELSKVHVSREALDDFDRMFGARDVAKLMGM